MATIVAITNEPKTGKPRTLTVNVGAVNLSYEISLNDTDGTVILAGKQQTFNYNPNATPIRSTSTVAPTTISTAQTTFANAVATAFIAYYEATNS